MRIMLVVNRNGNGHCDRSKGCYGKTEQETGIYGAPAVGGTPSMHRHIDDSPSNLWCGKHYPHFAGNWGTVKWSVPLPMNRHLGCPYRMSSLHVPREGRGLQGQVFGAEAKAGRFMRPGEERGSCPRTVRGEGTGRLCPPSKQQPCPSQLELGLPGMKPCFC